MTDDRAVIAIENLLLQYKAEIPSNNEIWLEWGLNKFNKKNDFSLIYLIRLSGPF